MKFVKFDVLYLITFPLSIEYMNEILRKGSINFEKLTYQPPKFKNKRVSHVMIEVDER